MSWKRTPRVSMIAVVMLVMAFACEVAAIATSTTQPAGVALGFSAVAFVLLMSFQ